MVLYDLLWKTVLKQQNKWLSFPRAFGGNPIIKRSHIKNSAQ